MNIILEGPNGERIVEANKPYKLLPGEHIKTSSRRQEKVDEVNKLRAMASAEGIGVGDLIAKLTKQLGIKPCAKCEQRRQVLNKLRVQGWKIVRFPDQNGGK